MTAGNHSTGPRQSGFGGKERPRARGRQARSALEPLGEPRDPASVDLQRPFELVIEPRDNDHVGRHDLFGGGGGQHAGTVSKGDGSAAEADEERFEDGFRVGSTAARPASSALRITSSSPATLIDAHN
jgi:hypothetical protein